MGRMKKGLVEIDKGHFRKQPGQPKVDDSQSAGMKRRVRTDDKIFSDTDFTGRDPTVARWNAAKCACAKVELRETPCVEVHLGGEIALELHGWRLLPV